MENGDKIIVQETPRYRVAKTFKRLQKPEGIVHSYELNDDYNIGNQNIQAIVNEINQLENLHNEECKMEIYLSDNQIGDQGCQHFKKGKWKNMTLFYIFQNFIGWKGCQSMAKCDWFNLQFLQLAHNSIGDKGLGYLCKAQWHNLAEIELYGNEIGEIGCHYLSKSKWAKLSNIYIRKNKIVSQGCRKLFKTQWNQLKHLDLMQNQITNEGRNYLASAQFESLVLLLTWNIIDSNGKDFFVDKNWNVFLNNNIKVLGQQKILKNHFKQNNYQMCMIYLGINLSSCRCLTSLLQAKIKILFYGKYKINKNTQLI